MLDAKLAIFLTFALIVGANAAIAADKTPPKDNEVTVDGPTKDPCTKVRCNAGKECIVDQETMTAKCHCVRECAENEDSRRKVCSSRNVTWESDCHLHQHRCLCTQDKLKNCVEEDKHEHIDYYGGCMELATCPSEVLEDFPRRMREWLYTIMEVKVTSTTVETETDDDHQTKKWVDAVIWKFCDLDKQPHDRKVSRHELFPLRAPLLSMEPCIGIFLDNCDANDDHIVDLVEWGQCLGADKDELEDKCNLFVNGKKN